VAFMSRGWRDFYNFRQWYASFSICFLFRLYRG
jgi:hypothetical protein